LLTVVVCIATPRAAPPPETPVVERVEVSAVSVPVQVTLDGEPLRGLSTANFELFDRGKKQSLSALDVIDLELLKRPPDHGWAPQLPVAGRRHFLIVFDLSFTRPASIQRARRDMRQWVSNSLDPTDLVAVATYSVNRGPKLILNFSSDRDQIAKAITRLGELDVVDQHTDPLAFAVGALQDGGADMDFDTALEYGFSNAEENTLLDVLLRDVYQGASQRLFDQQRRQPIHRMSQTFGELAQLMRALQGRKYLIYLSEGFDSSLIFSDHRPERVLRANRALESGEMWRVDSTRRFGSGPTQSSIFAMLEEFRRADCVIQAVDVGEFRNSAGSRSLPAFTESLQLMANETGGELYRDFDDVGQALDEMLRMTSLTYVLWFTPRKISADGEFHRLKVKLKGVPKKAEVSHRPGYFAPAPRSARSAEQDRLALGQRIMAGQAGGSISTSILAAPFRKEPHRAFVPVLIEIDGPIWPA
jgi:VWFA-related protein